MQINPTLHTAALAGLEASVNRALALSPHTGPALARLDGQVFCLECTSPTVAVYLQPNADGGLRFMGVHEGPVTTRVRGSSSEFARLAASQDPAATLINANLELEGSSAPLVQLQQIFTALDIDWEAPLVDALGDVAGHEVAKILRAGFTFGQQARHSLERQLQEFVHEEARLTPPALELEDFYGDLQTLVLRVDRLESRLARAGKRIDVLRAKAATHGTRG